MRKTSMYLALGALLTSLAGCAVTPTELRGSGPEHQVSLVAQQNYQPIYRTVLERQRDCAQQGLITASIEVQGDLFHDIRSGTITTALHGAFGVKTLSVVDLKAIDDRSTEVVVTSATTRPGEYADLIRKWLAGSRECNV